MSICMLTCVCGAGGGEGEEGEGVGREAFREELPDDFQVGAGAGMTALRA